MVKLVYKDVAIGADADAAVTTTPTEPFCDPALIPFGVERGAIATLELNGWGLDGSYDIRGDSETFAFWSAEKSGADCRFGHSPVITLEFDNQYTSTALSVRFGAEERDYCSEMTVEWYRGAALLASITVYPGSPEYVLNNAVTDFTKLVFTLTKTSLPERRAKIEYIAIGAVRTFTTRELTSVSFVNECSLVSDKVPINVCDAAFVGEDDVDYIFQKKQPVYGYDGSSLIGVYYITKGTRLGTNTYKIECDDIIGTLDTVEHSGALWLTDTPLSTALELFGDVCTFEVAQEYASATVRGYIKPGTLRDALRDICFALGAVADTSGTSAIKIFPAAEDASIIDARQTYTGGSVAVSDIVTAVSVMAYTISNTRPGDDDEYITYNGVKYKVAAEEKTAANPTTVPSDLPNVVAFDGVYLINGTNGQDTADRLMNYYLRRNTYTASHVLGGEKPGDMVNISLPWNDRMTGHIVKMTLTVSNIIVTNSNVLEAVE